MKVGCEISLTLRLEPKDSNQYMRLRFNLDDVDTDTDLEIQLGKAQITMNQIFDIVSDKIQEEVAKIK